MSVGYDAARRVVMGRRGEICMILRDWDKMVEGWTDLSLSKSHAMKTNKWLPRLDQCQKEMMGHLYKTLQTLLKCTLAEECMSGGCHYIHGNC
jgi:hypothetical protein